MDNNTKGMASDAGGVALPQGDRATHEPSPTSGLGHSVGVPSAAVLSAWPERRPERTAHERAADAAYYARHLPEVGHPVSVADDDLDAMRAAFVRRFGEQLPRTETLMAVAHVGYRMALRDAAPIGDAPIPPSASHSQGGE